MQHVRPIRRIDLPPTLEEVLRGHKVPVPDQKVAWRMKRAARLELFGEVPAWRICLAWYRLFDRRRRWMKLGWNDYVGAWAGKPVTVPPPTVHMDKHQVDSAIPDLSHQVCASRMSAWHVVSCGSERVILGG